MHMEYTYDEVKYTEEGSRRRRAGRASIGMHPSIAQHPKALQHAFKAKIPPARRHLDQ